MKELNKTQKKIYEYLSERLPTGIPPTVREIGEAVGLKSPSSVQANLNSLEEMGLISRSPNRKRALTIVTDANPVVKIPLLGTVTAGIPILATEQIETYIPFPVKSRDKQYFALRVRGDSMINAGIFSGDILIVEKTPAAENGDIVVAMIDTEATVKRFFREDGHFRLQPENDNYEPIISDSVVILGKAAGLYRNFK